MLFERIAMLFKIITRMKLLFWNYLGVYSYSLQGSSELISTTVTLSLFHLHDPATENIPPSGFFKSLLQLHLHNLIVFEFKM